jgi:hypothetical protein
MPQDLGLLALSQCGPRMLDTYNKLTSPVQGRTIAVKGQQHS